MEGGGNLKEPKMFRKGCMEDPSSDGGGVLMYSDLSVRMAFIQKVFMLLMLQLSVAAAFIALFTFRLIYIVTIIIMSCFEAPRRQVPCNYICMMLVTLSLSFMTGAIAAYYKTEVVLLAAITCCICCFIVAVFATQSKCDLTPYTWAFFAAGIALIVFGIVAMIARMYWNMKARKLVSFAFRFGLLYGAPNSPIRYLKLQNYLRTL
ncbi:hypothetical protein D918_07982 [Trichuris suis]|nr:hypothetical protein D918_07982 [Trichuris suis]